jgi:hypothetical protein
MTGPEPIKISTNLVKHQEHQPVNNLLQIVLLASEGQTDSKGRPLANTK